MNIALHFYTLPLWDFRGTTKDLSWGCCGLGAPSAAPALGDVALGKGWPEPEHPPTPRQPAELSDIFHDLLHMGETLTKGKIWGEAGTISGYMPSHPTR